MLREREKNKQIKIRIEMFIYTQLLGIDCNQVRLNCMTRFKNNSYITASFELLYETYIKFSDITHHYIIQSEICIVR